MKVTDNFIEEKYFKELQHIFLSNGFPWYFSIIDHESYEDHDYHFSHVFSPEDPCSELILPALDLIKPKKILRIKANLQTRTKKNITQSFHLDQEDPNITVGILYLNTCNGYTLFSDGTKVESVENRFVEFSCSSEHAGVTCTDQPGRFVINFNYYK
jgi:hypothetical protein